MSQLDTVRRARRFGLLDLMLVVLASGSVWLRTPVGASMDFAVRWGLGAEASRPVLTAYFEVPERKQALAKALETLSETTHVPSEVPEGGFPQPWRTAAALVLPDIPAADLDAAYGGDPGSALEAVSIGPELTARAVTRARAAGIPNPEHYSAHRAFLPAAAARKADAEVEATLALAKLLEMQWPVTTEHRISSGYGMRTHPVTGVHKLHNGVDLAVPVGTDIVAVQSGRVAAIGEDNANGRFVVIDHGSKVRTSYCHLDEQLVKRGDTVSRGAKIALSGNTGRSTGPHLHFTLRVGKRTVDPLPLRRPTE
ncbi:MAG: M23 family metallopeptidase [Proteobacteria bacterium]|nr:M23 family metallopeptidase [Pseudomonadota bacterium]